MYWSGNTEWMACGTGAASYINNVRFTRPKSIKKYFDYVSNINSVATAQDTLLQQIETIIMCSLRTFDGLKFSQIEYFMSDNDLKQF